MASPFSRRHFLAGAAGVGVAGAAAAAGASRIERALDLGGSGRPPRAPSAHPASARAAGASSASDAVAGNGGSGKGTLVLITLYGGNDGLNTVIPVHDGAYLGGRPTLAIPADQVLPLDSQLALHPSLTGLKRLWDKKQLGVVLGVGYPNPNRSHFRSMDIWQSAVPDTDEVTGWLGRWLDSTGADPLRALSLGPTLPKLLGGQKTSGGSLPSGALRLPGGDKLAAPYAALERTYPGEAPLAGRVAQSGTDLLTVIKTAADILSGQPPTDIGATNLEGGGADAPQPAGSGAPRNRPGGELASQLDVVARLIKGGAPTHVYSVSLGGFDTHAGEKETHARLLAELDSGIAGFLDTLDGDPHGDHVVVMAYSEFGRRVNANASGGTDHGTAAPVLVAGKGVHGGFYGEQPSLTDLDHGDLKFTTDFRSVYTTLMANVMGIDPKPVLSGRAFPMLAFV